MNNDPYHDHKIVHMAKQMNNAGEVSPECANKPRKINLKISTWTLRWEAVTCPNCLARKPKDLPL